MRIDKYQFALLLLLFVCNVLQASNNLKNHPSPYLAMHGDDPVQWRDWGEAAVKEARESGKLLYLSSGYFSCHWCHVMQRESYQNSEIAELLNKWFVPVKVDRELQPALDAYLISFVEKTEGHAGWPLNVFLTPDGYPVVGMTYVPAEQFQALLSKLHLLWVQEPQRLRDVALSIHKQMQQLSSVSQAETLPDGEKLLQQAVKSALAVGDDLQGGFGRINHFPMAPQLRLLLEAQRLFPSQQLESFLRLTLNQMAIKGLRDHLAGGFFRYTVDPGWETPHYEKMLYTQAQLVSLYLRAASLLKEPRYEEVASDTLDFVLQHMRESDGAYIASLSAVDAQGNEGGSYLWREQQLKELLSEEELKLARQHWLFTFGEQLPGQALPHAGALIESIAKAEGESPQQLSRKVERIRSKLMNQRSTREAPRDSKQLAAWNGLMLTAFSEAAAQLNRDDYRKAAAELAGWLTTLWDGEQLLRSTQEGRAVGTASLADYAYAAQGLKSWAQVSGDSGMLKLSEQMTAVAWQRFFTHNGWRLGEKLLIPGLKGKPLLSDGPMPAPSAVLMGLSDSSKQQMEQALKMSAEKVSENPFWNAGHLWQLYLAQK
ncbi:MAG: thioredoxin domain-containing protein [Gammaproteobacteria bacterium]|nr:thioredoxin domain-containing protein [Gammaproteobacteria bacterium]